MGGSRSKLFSCFLVLFAIVFQHEICFIGSTSIHNAMNGMYDYEYDEAIHNEGPIVYDLGER